MRAIRSLSCVIAGLLLSMSAAFGAEWGLKEGTPELKSAGSLAFGPDGILFVGDAKGATVYAIGTGDTKGNPAKVELNVSGLNSKVAELLGVNADKIAINDLAVNPLRVAGADRVDRRALRIADKQNSVRTKGQRTGGLQLRSPFFQAPLGTERSTHRKQQTGDDTGQTSDRSHDSLPQWNFRWMPAATRTSHQQRRPSSMQSG